MEISGNYLDSLTGVTDNFHIIRGRSFLAGTEAIRSITFSPIMVSPKTV